MSDALFYLFAFFTVASAIGVVANKNAVNAAMCLMLCLVGVASLFVLLDAYLLAALLVLVYAGAVVALFLFIVMLLDMQGGVKRPFRLMTAVASVAALALMLVGVTMLKNRGELGSLPAPVDVGAPVGAVLKGYAELLFTTYLLPVQIIGFLLLIAMLGVIVLSKKFEGLEDIK
ncbi:MAG TPA: NADH-quinone oxidoreductase subunit J [Opitutaceae bacterium]|nr:NADH-quinone oxidoreductase subunit J [Opitutaceae bacterium]